MWDIGGKQLNSRLFIGSALYPSLEVMEQAVVASKAEVITVSLRRQTSQYGNGNAFWSHIKELKCHLLPNTAGCFTAKEAITTAQMAREVFETNWIKLEVIGDEYTLQPDPFQLLEATKELIAQGFEVFPYCTDDLVLCDKLINAGCQILMPWGAPIGTGKGLMNPYALRILRTRFKEFNLLIDAGLGAPSHATQAMELGFDGVLLNTAIAEAHDPVRMAEGFCDGVKAGRNAFLAGIIPERDMAQPSTPTVGKPFWHYDEG
jgi:thiazole synthase